MTPGGKRMPGGVVADCRSITPYAINGCGHAGPHDPAVELTRELTRVEAMSGHEVKMACGADAWRRYGKS